MLTLVEFLFITPEGDPISNTEVEIQLLKPAFDEEEDGVVMPRPVFITTDENGEATLELAAVPEMYGVSVYDPLSEAHLCYKFYVPEMDIPGTPVRLQDIVVEGPISKIDYDEAALLIIHNAKANAVAASNAAQVAQQIAESAAEQTQTNLTNSNEAALAAETSAAAALTHAQTAGQHRLDAGAYADAAEVSNVAADAQAVVATTKAAESAASAAVSSTKAAEALTSKAGSDAAAAASLASAGIASNKANEASTSATNAAIAKAAAEAARDQALTAFDNFDDRMLGQKSSDPSVDNDGNPLIGGALYFNTNPLNAGGGMRVYDSVAGVWFGAYASLSGALLRVSNLSDLENAATARTNLGLGNLDNTSDVNKPVSTAQQAALNFKANLNNPTFTGTVGGITKAMVGLGSVDNKSSETIRSEITSLNVTTALGFTPYNATNPSGFITNSALSPYLTAAAAVSGYQPLDADLTSIAGLASNAGFLKKTATNTWSLDTSTYLTEITSSQVTTALGFTPYSNANPDGFITSDALSAYLTTANAALSYQALDADLTAIAALTGTTGFLKKTATNTWTLDASPTYLPLAGGTVSGTLIVNAAFSNTIGSASFSVGAASQTTGTITLGGNLSTSTGAIVVGQSATSQTLGLGVGATAAAATKTVNVGTGGLASSTTNITIGSAVASSTTNLTSYGGWSHNGILNLNNNNLNNVNNITISDVGTGEGIEWLGGSGWKIYESPDNLSNAAGNLQFVTGSTRRGTLDTTGWFEAVGGLKAPQITVSTSNDYMTNTTGLESWTYAADFSVSAQTTEPRGIQLSADGTKMYVVGNTGGTALDSVIQYALGTAWSLATATYTQAFLLATQTTSPLDLFFKPDGTVMYVLDDATDVVLRYNLGTAWDISTAVYANSFSVAAQETNVSAIAFSTDGTKMYVGGTTGDDINQYNLSTAWDITTAVYANLFSIAAYATAQDGLAFNNAGTTFWVVDNSWGRIVEYTLGTAWDITTAVYSKHIAIYTSGAYLVSSPSGVFVNEAQGKAYFCDYSTDRVFELTTNLAATKFVGSKFYFYPDTHFRSDITVYGNIRAETGLYVAGAVTISGALTSNTIGTTSASGTNSVYVGTTSGTVNVATGISTGILNIGTGQTTGSVTIGGTGATGAITVGRATTAQTINIGIGATATATTKTLNLGTAGVSGSTTNINYGSAVTGATSNHTFNGLVTLPQGQIKFPASQNASADANTLDDYEEGTFTPELRFGGATTGIAYNTRRGTYTKVGNIVTIQIGIYLSSSGSATGSMTITGLPFTSVNQSFGSYGGEMFYGQSGFGSVTGVTFGVINENSSILYGYIQNNGAETPLTKSNIATYFQFKTTYQAA